MRKAPSRKKGSNDTGIPNAVNSGRRSTGLDPTTEEAPGFPGGFSGADDEIRTRDPHLGKVMLYQLSYVRNGSRV